MTEEPVRRYLDHAIANGAPLFSGALFVYAEQRFGSFTLPSRVSVGWWFGTPRYAPFFDATILSIEPIR